MMETSCAIELFIQPIYVCMQAVLLALDLHSRIPIHLPLTTAMLHAACMDSVHMHANWQEATSSCVAFKQPK